MVAGLYQSGTKIWYQLPMFTLEVLAITLILSYLRFRSGSVWPAIILHAAHNYFDQVICGPLTKAEGQAYFVGETGFMTAFLLVAVALFVAWKWKKETAKETAKEAEMQN